MSRKPALDRCVVVVNSGSTHYARGLRFVEQLSEYFPAERLKLVEVSETEYRDGRRLIGKLKDKLDARTLLAIAAGDGTISLIINLLLNDSALEPAARQAVILPLWGGNANDLAYMVNGSVRKASIKNLLERGRVVPIRPLRVTIKQGGHSATKLAVCYASFGASAHAARNVSRPAHRHRAIYRLTGARMATDMASIARSFTISRPFLSEFNGRLQPLYDLVLINGSRLAKINRVGPGHIAEPTFYAVRLRHKYPAFALYLAHIARGVAFRHATQTELSFTVRQATWAQLDGEAQPIEADTLVSVKPNHQPFYVLTTKL